MKSLLFITGLFFCLTVQELNAQNIELFESVEYQKAVAKGTRSKNGKPGQNYWQNHSDYKIDVALSPEDHSLSAKAQIVYHNESPDTLTEITFRLYQDRYKKGAIRSRKVHPDDLHDGVSIDSLIINNTRINDVSTRHNGTNLTVQLPSPLFPKSTAQIDIKWNFKIPTKTHFRRMGYFKDGAYFIGLWYPQIAVYDDIYGWDKFTFHTGVQEFYNDYNNYEVKITVPDGYVVWATGDLLNENKIFAPNILEKLKKAKTTDETVNIITSDDYTLPVVNDSVWFFKASYISDFAFGAAKNFLWDGTSVIVEEKSKRRVFVDVAFHPGSDNFYGAIDIARQSIAYYSKENPGIPFPYSHATSFNGIPDEANSAMEFPMIANDCNWQDSSIFKFALVHELFHNYFPFYVGTNEKQNTWMDEGWAFLIEHDFCNDILKEKHPRNPNQIYSFLAGTRVDFPLYTTSETYNKTNKGYYYAIKPFVIFSLLRDLLGKEIFTSILQEYIRLWHGKHPTPYDFFYTFNEVSGENINWFWETCFFEFGYPDLELNVVDGEKIIVKKIGNIPLPIKLTINYEDGTNKEIVENLRIWKDGGNEYSLIIDKKKKVKSIKLGDPKIPDINKANNYYGFK